MARDTRCVCCNKYLGNAAEAVRERLAYEVTAINRGGAVAYICADCTELEYPYSARNTRTEGSWKKGRWTASIELETMGANCTGQAELLSHGYIPTSDCTVWREYKSPIYRGFGGLVKYTKSVQAMLDSADIRIDHHCGCHMHIGREECFNHLTGEVYQIDSTVLDGLWRYRDELLGPLGEYLDYHPDQCAAVFGRELSSDWADTIRRATYRGRIYAGGVQEWEPMEREHSARYGFCNLATSSDCTIEWRILYFADAGQYGKAIMLCKALTELLLWAYDYIASPQYTEEEKRNKARQAGQKMVKKFREAAGR